MSLVVSSRKLKKLLNVYYPLSQGGFFARDELSLEAPLQLMSNYKDDSVGFVGWGFKKTSEKVRKHARQLSLPYWAIEDAFVRSFDLTGKSEIPLGLVLDKTGVYYDASCSSDLEQWLNEETVTSGQLEEARLNIAMLRDLTLSKYNTFSVKGVLKSGSYVLVIDQVFGDASVAYGQAGQQSFDDMLEAAFDLYPQSKILLKVHPDVFSDSSKSGYFDLDLLSKHERIEIVTDRINPWGLFELVDVVFTVTSQMGFEALMAGKKVHCYGMPFYAGWGLTEDILTCDRRVNTRSVEEVFYFAYVKYAQYINPFLKKTVDLADVCHIIADQRRHAELNISHDVCVGFSPWKKRFLADFLCVGDSSLKFVSSASDVLSGLASISLPSLEQPARIVVWASSSVVTDVKQLIYQYSSEGNQNTSVVLMEDGFLRSVGLGADLARPASLVLDSVGIYYDAAAPSELENLLQSHGFFECDLERARLLRQSLFELRLSKYNVGKSVDIDELLPIDCRLILVPGQVEDDASIKKGCVDINTNLGLLKAVREANPNAFVVYKQHPDVLKAGRKGLLNKADISTYADLEAESGSILDWIDKVDEVHTMTSLAGFEALLREKKVVTYGLPFYAGWGLTQDRHQCERRNRKRTLDELVAAALIYYPTYVDPVTRQVCNVETIVERLAGSLDRPHKPSVKTQFIRAAQRWKNKLKE